MTTTFQRLPAEAYRSDDSVNFSTLKNILVSPAHYRASCATTREETLDMRLGTFAHAYWLEGKRGEYVIQPEANPDDPSDKWHGSKKWCKAWKAAQTLPIYSAEEYERQSRIVNALFASDDANTWLAACPERELSIFTTYRGVKIKCRLDAVGYDAAGNRLILDLKKTLDGSPRAWGKRAYDFGYDMQAALYRAALATAEGLEEAPKFLWVTVEDSEAAPVTIYSLTAQAEQSGQRKLDQAIDLWKQCTESGEWPAYGSGVMEPVWPAWGN